jgi:hypothetical protein
MRIYLKAFVMNLTKSNKEVAKLNFLPALLNKIEKEMKAGTIDSAGVMDRIRSEEKIVKVLKEGEFKMIEAAVKKMIK